MTFPDGGSADYLYDGWGRLVATPSLFGTDALNPGFAYGSSGALAWIGRANGISTPVYPEEEANRESPVEQEIP